MIRNSKKNYVCTVHKKLYNRLYGYCYKNDQDENISEVINFMLKFYTADELTRSPSSIILNAYWNLRKPKR